MSQLNGPNWTVIQLGAREHYAVARALEQSGRLAQLVTDVWTTPGTNWRMLSGKHSQKIAGRYHTDLKDANVNSFSRQAFFFELKNRLGSKDAWDLIEKRNEHFQHLALQKIKGTLNSGSIVFVYSYAARNILEYCKSISCTTILGQIDPGIYEENLVAECVSEHPEFAGSFHRAPKSYWENWHRECELADIIAVNSEWSKEALEQSGVNSSKLRVLPLAYESIEPAIGINSRKHPKSFSRSRPLNVLFLGQAIPRKGIHLVLECAREVEELPIQFTIVGNLNGLERLYKRPNIRAVGNQPRDTVKRFYQSADVFLFPTLSDGFGLTQLEARHWNLPLICSRNCAHVVEHDQNGWLLEEPTTDSITSTLTKILESPETLKRWSSHPPAKRFDLKHLILNLISMESQTCYAE